MYSVPSVSFGRAEPLFGEVKLVHLDSKLRAADKERRELRAQLDEARAQEEARAKGHLRWGAISRLIYGGRFGLLPARFVRNRSLGVVLAETAST